MSSAWTVTERLGSCGNLTAREEQILVFAFPFLRDKQIPTVGNCMAANQPPIPERLSISLHRLIAHRKIIRETRLAKPPSSLKQEKQENSSGAFYIPAPFERGFTAPTDKNSHVISVAAEKSTHSLERYQIIRRWRSFANPYRRAVELSTAFCPRALLMHPKVSKRPKSKQDEQAMRQLSRDYRL